MEICNYYNNAQVPVILSIDDLSFTAFLNNDEITAADDWGYGLNNKNSLWQYLDSTLFSVFPEIRGTIFFPISAKHGAQNQNAGHQIVFRDFDDDTINFLHFISTRFELAFHGTIHSRYIDIQNPIMHQNLQQEFEFLSLYDVPRLKTAIHTFQEKYNIHFSGGKYPGYVSSKDAEGILESLGFDWWMRNSYMCNRRCSYNSFSYFGSNNTILDIPTNISSNILQQTLNHQDLTSWKGIIKHTIPFISLFLNTLKFSRGLSYLEYLYDNGLPITIQTHFMNRKTDGNRQTPNIYDDILSLSNIYSTLRGTNVWHTTCGELASYIRSRDQASIQNIGNKSIISFSDCSSKNKISVKSKTKKILEEHSGTTIYGQYNNGYWIYNNISAGTYVKQ